MPEDKADRDTSTDGKPSSAGRLEDLASRLAESHVTSRRPGPGPSLLRHLQVGAAFLRDAYDYLVRESEAEKALSYAAEWLLDNFYIIQQAGRQIHEDLPAGYYRQLPKLDTAPLKGYPRIYALAQQLIKDSEGRIDINRLTRFVRAYQQITPLTMGELWALPTMLRLVILDLLTATVAQVVEWEPDRTKETAALIALPDDLAGDTIVANCITSLRTLATQDWKAFFEDVSQVEQTLRSEPANVYAGMDFDTRDRYRKVIEEIALATGGQEERIAREAVNLASEHFAPEEGRFSLQELPRAAHVGFYLLDEGRAQLEARLGYCPTWGTRLRRWMFNHATQVYLGSIGLLTLAMTLGLVGYARAAGGTFAQLAGAALLSLLPATVVAVNLANWLFTHAVPARVLPKMDFSAGVPVECRTMVVIPALLSTRSEIEFLLQQVELHYLGNRDPHLHFALLTDFADAPKEHMPEDEELLEQARAGVRALNMKYSQDGPGPFYLFHRRRQWNPAEDHWMGWERKRGKLVEFNRLVEGEEGTSFIAKLGNLEVLPQIRYVITLDADTTLPRESARRLIGTMAHPLNRATFDPDSGAVEAGYTVLQPRTEVKPSSVNRSPFARIFSGDAGLDLYTRAVSDVYHDLFGEGIYVGKGIYGVHAFSRSLAGRVPENALLSHDLFEGIHGRAGLVTDVVLYEDYPPGYLAYAHRLHRWVRGDWQLLPWLCPRVPHAGEGKIPNELQVIDRWKILDNLRRSLRTPALLALLIAGWLWLPGSPLVWTLAGLVTSAVPLITSVFTGVTRGLQRPPLSGAASALRVEAARWLLELAFLPYEAVIMVDAIGTTLVRLTISHKRLLQWTTAAHTIRLFGQERKVALTWRQMGAAPAIALGLAVVAGLIDPAALPVATPLLLAWLASPQIALRISNRTRDEPAPLSEPQRRQLRHIARRTWLYFERFVGPDDHWLPPDHFQEHPRGLVAHRTSPTNVGLLLLSTLSAYELGYIGPIELTLRLRATFETMDELERYRGHFLNWYDTHSLKPLSPRYVSTVDSGNLGGSLLALRQGCLAVRHTQVLGWQRWQGLLDTLDILVETVEGLEGLEARELKEAAASLGDHLTHICQEVSTARETPERWAVLLSKLGNEDWERVNRLLMALVEAGADVLGAATLHELRIWSERVHHRLLRMQDERDLLLPWLEPLDHPPALFAQAETTHAITEAWQGLRELLPTAPQLDEIPAICRAGNDRLREMRKLLDEWANSAAQDSSRARVMEQVEAAQEWCERLAENLDSARSAAESLLIGLQDLGDQAESYFQAMDFRFLFDRRRQVFHIGYDVDSGMLSNSYYDLLASEARTASLVTIGKGDVPQSHWLHMSRPLTQVDGMRVLLSWNGSMFEYLMPALLMHSYEGTLLDQTYRAVVQQQIAYARQRGVLWGISESGYYRFDGDMNYQYRGFGVPGLGRKRGLGEDVVITPYASLLALTVNPQAVMENIDGLTEAQMLGPYGFYEAIDYTQSRLPLGQDSAIVQSYMSHHQGMIMLALINYLQDDDIACYFHNHPLVQSVELLLQEQIPQQAPTEQVREEGAGVTRPVQPRVKLQPWHAAMDAPLPQVHFLSNGRYGVLITSAGGGYSQYTPGGAGEPREGPFRRAQSSGEAIDLTRWRADTTIDDWGTWIYVKDEDSGRLWSATYQPTRSTLAGSDVLFHPHKAEFRRRDHDVSLRTEITVTPGEDVEIRRVILTNHSDRPRHLTVTSYGEVVLAPQATDRRHPAFNKMFTESEYVPELNGLLFRRRPRSAQETPVYLAHAVVGEKEESIVAYESDRGRFLGRGGTAQAPMALLTNGGELSGTTGATLDPIMALAQRVELEPHAETWVAYITLVAGSRQEALNLARRYRSFPAIERAFDRAHAQSERDMRQRGIDSAALERFQQLLSALLYPYAALRSKPEVLATNSEGQSRLWPYAISGDYPILLARVSNQEETALVRELLQAHAYWRDRRIKIDLVILNQRDAGYAQELQDQLHRLITHMDSDAWLHRRGGIFLLRAAQMPEADQVLLETAARVVADGEKGELAEQLKGLLERPTRLPRFVPTEPRPKEETTPALARPTDLQFDNGLGGFSADGHEYIVYLEADQRTPAPWINVIANPYFGFLVSEAGGGYTWAENSGENRLTPWHNDPVTDVPGEALYLRDEKTAHVWSPTPLPAPTQAPYLIRHGAGYSVFEHHSHGLKQRLRLFAAADAPVKVVQLRLENTWERPRRITATYYAEWVLGTSRDAAQQYVIPQFDTRTGALLARNPYNEEFGERVAFLAASKEPHGLTADRTEFLGREGSRRHPAALDRMGLAGTVRAGLDPCAALQIHLDLNPGETQEVFFLLGQGADQQEAIDLVEQYQDPAKVEDAREAVRKLWDNLLGAVTVETPDPAMDLLLNRWLLYQALSCRVWARSAFYQSSGAFGYRDQLQDVMALVHAAPELAREHILRAACHQFEEGDVLHWWHPPSGRGASPEPCRGVRTRISDDLLWLPFVTAHYVAATSDASILTEKVPFRTGEPLKPEEEERYDHYAVTTGEDTLYEHCRRALEKGSTSGPHGLPLMGTGDWNDGMNRVGIEGQGESVWLGWFLYGALTRFARLCERMDDEEQAATYREWANDLLRALEKHAWDGEWYRRAYYDDGTPLGSAENHECQIDSIAQSWAVLSGAADSPAESAKVPERAGQAMEAVSRRLVRHDDQLILLFTPPFGNTARDPGYIKGYPPGIRENGGQYTHAALWAAWAFAELGQGERAGALFRLLNPIHHSDTPEKRMRYRVEPYAVAADVYSVEPHTGRGGWTWYTGSSGWMYRLGLEAILGVHRTGTSLRIDPRIPRDWPGYEVTYRYGKTPYRIRVENLDGAGQGVKEVTVDGEPPSGTEIPLQDDGQQHEVHVLMG